jgi:hypothetical protein
VPEFDNLSRQKEKRGDPVILLQRMDMAIKLKPLENQRYRDIFSLHSSIHQMAIDVLTHASRFNTPAQPLYFLYPFPSSFLGIV